ncbi:hypothetical protein ECDEC10B_1935 [Escherichia coli DEC10B]|nr:hypothetical protein ECDEC10B_1935 [Escherichia coli DEC10B]
MIEQINIALDQKGSENFSAWSLNLAAGAGSRHKICPSVDYKKE